MRKQLNIDEAATVSGGNIYINYNNGKFTFDTINTVFQFKDGVDISKAQALCQSKVGEYSTIEEYDAECLKALKAEGWVVGD